VEREWRWRRQKSRRSLERSCLPTALPLPIRPNGNVGTFRFKGSSRHKLHHSLCLQKRDWKMVRVRQLFQDRRTKPQGARYPRMWLDRAILDKGVTAAFDPKPTWLVGFAIRAVSPESCGSLGLDACELMTLLHFSGERACSPLGAAHGRGASLGAGTKDKTDGPRLYRRFAP
jgi:hypothetical protein